MARNTQAFPTTSTRRDGMTKTSRRAVGFDSSNPASRRINRSLRAAEFDQFARRVERDLNPRGPLENLVTRQAIRSAWRLQTNLDASNPDQESPRADRAARSLKAAISTLDLLQDRRAAITIDELPGLETGRLGIVYGDPEFESNEWPVVPTNFQESSALERSDETDEEPPIWQGRLVYDFDVSDHSPVIKGTWITVSHVVTLIIDGSTWADILRSHPELTEDDVRACVAYAIAEDHSQP